MGGGIGGLLNLNQDGQNYSYFYDGRGNVSALMDTNQTISASYSYDAFGNMLAKSGTLDQPYRFSTKPFDSKVGLSYYGYRFYSPGIGKWMTRDPLGEAGGMNLYGFVSNNPVNMVDPEGEFASIVGGIVGGALAGGLSGMISGAITGVITNPGNWKAIGKSALYGFGSGVAIGAVVGGLAGAGIIGPGVGLVGRFGLRPDFSSGLNKGVNIALKPGKIAGFASGVLDQFGALFDPEPTYGDSSASPCR